MNNENHNIEYKRIWKTPSFIVTIKALGLR